MVLQLAASAGVFPRKRIGAVKAAALTATMVGTYILGNQLLQHTSVRFYDASYGLTIAAVVAVDAAAYRRVLPGRLRGPIACVCIGAALSMAGQEVSPTGALLWVLCVLCQALYQSGCGALQRSLGVSPLQLLLYVAPLTVLMLSPMELLSHRVTWWVPVSAWDAEHLAGTVALLGLTGVLSIAADGTAFWLCRLSPVSYNMLLQVRMLSALSHRGRAARAPFGLPPLAGLACSVAGVWSCLSSELREARQV